MGPIKFEENIKNKLEKRTIEPSENAWNKLSANLDAQEDSSKNPVSWWLGIAATLVGIFLVSTLFIKTGDDKTVLPTLVETPIKGNKILQEEVPEIHVIVENEEGTSKENIKSSSNSKNVVLKQKNTLKTIKNISSKTKSEVAVYNVINQETIENIEEVNSSSIIKKTSNQEIIAQISEIGNVKDMVTDSEIELLLKNAEEDLVKKTNNLVRTKMADANSLLQDVETDLEQSFRDKMFNTLISGYNTLKTVVVERND